MVTKAKRDRVLRVKHDGVTLIVEKDTVHDCNWAVASVDRAEREVKLLAHQMSLHSTKVYTKTWHQVMGAAHPVVVFRCEDVTPSGIVECLKEVARKHLSR